MGAKRPYNKKNLKTYKKYGGKAKVLPAVKTIQAVVRRALQKNLEVKQSMFSTSDGIEISHNNFITLNSQMLYTTQGVQEGMTSQSVNRIGDQINLKGVSIKMSVELNERYSDVTYRLIVVRHAKGDTPSRATLFSGLSANKMLDTFNKERYTILASKTFKITARNTGTWGGQYSIVGTGTNGQLDGERVLSRASKIVKLWIPGTKFSKTGVIQYEDNSSQVKFFDYTAVIYAYSNYSTLQDLYNVGRVNDYIQQLYYTDA